MDAIWKLGRSLAGAVGLAALVVGGLGLAGEQAPDNPLSAIAATPVADVAQAIDPAVGEAVAGALGGGPLALGFAVVGAVLLVFASRSREGKLPQAADGEDPFAHQDHVLPVDKKLSRKASRRARSLAKQGKALDAADLCFEHGLMEEAADHFIAAGEYIRAAEIRHDQNRFIESAELYLKAGSYDSAGTIFSQQGEHARAAEAYLKSGNQSVAAEMFEKAGDWRRAAEGYDASDFPRHAAKAWVKCGEWVKAATCLEAVISEGMGAAAQADPKRRAETLKLARMAGDLFQRGHQADKARAVLERAECWGAAAEIAMQASDLERAADLFQRAGDAPRAAEALHQLGRGEDSLRLLGEHHRDRGEDEQAASYFAQAGDHMAAGDLYRMLEQYDKAGDAYATFGEHAQAAEMFNLSGERERAAECYEKAGLHAQAAECYALLGEPDREAELLAKAGEHLRAGRIHHERGDDDSAIRVLQQVGPEHTDFPDASAILGEIFRQRGMLSLALKKLTHAVGDSQPDRENIQAFYGLATVHEASENPQEALELYEKILAFDIDFADAAERLERCKKLVASQTEAEREASQNPLSGSQQQGRYEITGKLGRGGMGVVYKARDCVLDRVVAFKVLPDTLRENPQALKNFLREAKSAAQLNHPNIVQVYDAGEQDGVFFIAMEYVDGNTLKEIVKARGRISAGGIVHVVTQMCEALAYAHEQKIVHRDIKTANTMWTRDRKAKIMDFGLAKVIEEVRNHTTVVSGTPYYMSPEQTLGKNVDHRTDLYSLGVTLFELATGTLPFREGNLPYHHVHTPPPDPREFEPELPEVLVRIISRCLQKDPADRYRTAREILEELRNSLSS